MKNFSGIVGSAFLILLAGCASTPRGARHVANFSSGALYCAQSAYGTPTETTNHAAIAYQTIQVDPMGGSTLQISVFDDYTNGAKNEDYQVKWLEPKASDGLESFNGLMLGDYARAGRTTKDLSIVRLGQRIELIKSDLGKNSTTTFHCEIPGRYDADYSDQTEKGRLTGW